LAARKEPARFLHVPDEQEVEEFDDGLTRSFRVRAGLGCSALGDFRRVFVQIGGRLSPEERKEAKGYAPDGGGCGLRKYAGSSRQFAGSARR